MAAPVAAAQDNRVEALPGWIGKLCIGLVIYVILCATLMMTGFGGERVRHFVGLLADAPACFAALLVTATATYRMAPGTSRRAWACLSGALAMYFIGTVIGINSWLHGQDPFPGYSDIFYLAFYPLVYASVAAASTHRDEADRAEVVVDQHGPRPGW